MCPVWSLAEQLLVPAVGELAPDATLVSSAYRVSGVRLWACCQAAKQDNCFEGSVEKRAQKVKEKVLEMSSGDLRYKQHAYVCLSVHCKADAVLSDV